jgi:hypothetical protein
LYTFQKASRRQILLTQTVNSRRSLFVNLCKIFIYFPCFLNCVIIKYSYNLTFRTIQMNFIKENIFIFLWRNGKNVM